MRILISAASKHGSTHEIAEHITETFVDRGLQTEIVDPEWVTNLEGYDAVILGSAVYAASWRKDAADFVERLGAELRTRPVWLFSSGPLGDEEDQILELRHLDQLMETSGARSHTWFAGKLDKDDLNFAEKTIIKMVKAPYGDYRQWAEIDEWTNSIADELTAS
jgi:menaquinone-dependent protoporphyrinogen oxidase